MRVDFYLLPATNQIAAEHFCCRLLNKIYLRQQTAYVLVTDQTQAKRIDDMLWTFKDDSFVPHGLLENNLESGAPILIGEQDTKPANSSIIVNLSAKPQLPKCYENFERVVELVINDAASKQLSREHYRAYQQCGYAIETHTIA